MNFFLKTLFIIITGIITISCTKEDQETPVYTGYYNNQPNYKSDLLLRIVSNKGTNSYFGSGSSGELRINTNLYVDNITGAKTITKINKTLDSIQLYDFNKPELGGLLYVMKDNYVCVYQFEFEGTKNKIKTTYEFIKMPISAGKKYSSHRANDDETKEMIDRAINIWYDFTQTIGSSEIVNSIKKSLSNKIDSLNKIIENINKSKNELINYINKQIDKNPEPIILPIENPSKNNDEQMVLDNISDEPSECKYSTIALTLSDPNVSNGITSYVAKGLGGEGNYIYKWSDGQVGNYAFFKESGKYAVTVTDEKGCSVTIGFEVKIVYDCSLTDLAIYVKAESNSASVLVTGGKSPYSYLWSNGNTSSTATNLQNGTYTVTVTDQFSCSKSENIEINVKENDTIQSIRTMLENKVWNQGMSAWVAKYQSKNEITFSDCCYGGSQTNYNWKFRYDSTNNKVYVDGISGFNGYTRYFELFNISPTAFSLICIPGSNCTVGEKENFPR